MPTVGYRLDGTLSIRRANAAERGRIHGLCNLHRADQEGRLVVILSTIMTTSAGDRPAGGRPMSSSGHRTWAARTPRCR
jgi:hypothetical protein